MESGVELIIAARAAVGYVWVLPHASIGGPLNRLAALVDRAESMLKKWRESPPKQPNSPGRPPGGKTLVERGRRWASELGWKANRKKAKEIAARDGYQLATVEREARKYFPK